MCTVLFISQSQNFLQMTDQGGVQPMQDGAVRVVLVGHSYIRCLRDYMSMSCERDSMASRYTVKELAERRWDRDRPSGDFSRLCLHTVHL